MRASNAVDFWRGLALVMIFINHIPGNVLSAYTLRNFAVCDAADLFVFLAGWSLSYATNRQGSPDTAPKLVGRLVWRAFDLYSAQLAITLLAVAMLATAAHTMQNPLFLEWHNAGPAFYDPVRAVTGMALLSYQLGYFNILPMYVVLLLMAPVFLLAARASRWLALALSLSLYGWCLTTGLTMPSWPSDEQWFFNPLCWQLLLLSGFLSAELARGADPTFMKVRRWLFWPACLVVGLGAMIAVVGIYPDPVSVPSPRLFFLFDKTYLSPARLINLFALCLAFAGAYRILQEKSSTIVAQFCRLGRHSLPVFCVGSLLALAAQIARFSFSSSLLGDLVLIGIGLMSMGLTAWFVEWRQRALR